MGLSAVVPATALAANSPAKTTIAATSKHCISQVTHLLVSAWDGVQVSRHGAYTSRRARALERYVHSASLARVVAVCLLTPVPVLTFVLAQELIPLDPPGRGWKTNYRWFIRSAINFMVLTLSFIKQGLIFLGPLQIPLYQVLVIAVITTGVYFGVLVFVSTVWVFPIPFANVLTTGVFTLLFFGVFVTVVGWRSLATTRRLSAHVRIFKGVLAVETIIVVVYPAFNAVFRRFQGGGQLAFLSVLFVLKLVMRLIMAYVLQRGKGGVSDEERWKARLPEVVVFSIELFHILYLTACLQGQQITVWATVGVALFDATGSVMSVRRLLRRSKMEMIVEQSNNSHQSGGPVVGLLDDVNQPPQSLKAFNSSPMLPTSISMRSVVPASVSKLLTIDSATSVRFSNRRRSSIMSFSASRRLSMTVETIANLKLAKRSSSRTSSYQSGKTAPRSVSRATNIDRRNHFSPQQNTGLSTEDEIARLESLSMTEYFLLVEYVKCIIPVMYGIFQVVLARLPNAVFYPSLANATPQDLNRARTNMAVFVSLKALSLMTFVLLLHCRLRFSVAHQLSFVLETAADDIQVKLAMLIPYCFFFFLDHNGVDYTFRFAWMDNR